MANYDYGKGTGEALVALLWACGILGVIVSLLSIAGLVLGIAWLWRHL